MNAEASGRWRCPECGRGNAPHDRFCGGCGYDDGEADPQDRDTYQQQADLRVDMEGGTARKVFKQLLGVWAIGYPVVSLWPLLSTGTNTTGATAVGGIASLIVAGALFGPWIIGIIILGVLVLVSPSPTPVIRHGPAAQRPDLLHGTPIWARGHGDAGPTAWDSATRQWTRACPNCGQAINPKRTWLCDKCGEPFAEQPPRRSVMDRLSRLGYIDAPEEPEHGRIGPLHWDKDLRRWVP